MALATAGNTWDELFPTSAKDTPSTRVSTQRGHTDDATFAPSGGRRIFVSAPSAEVPAPHASVSRSVSRFEAKGSRIEAKGLTRAALRRRAAARPYQPIAAFPADAGGVLGLAADGVAPAVALPLPKESLEEALYLTTKRCLDIVGGLVGIVLLSPVLLVAALLVKLTSRGPVLYPHKRVGQNGRLFTCYKFRSMVVDADRQKASLWEQNSHSDPRTFKIPDDPRVTRVGIWLRRLSIDELPQLVNVLLGDMSLVGPRPAIPSEVELYSPTDRLRLLVKPGLTCIWQVSGRSRLAFPEQVQLDIDYIEQRCLALDLRLILLTIPAVLSSDGAY